MNTIGFKALYRWVLCGRPAAKTLNSASLAGMQSRRHHHPDPSSPIVFVDAPITLNPVDLARTFGTTVEALGAAESQDTTDPALTPRGWWEKRPDGQSISGLETSLELLRDVLKNDRFDVCPHCPGNHPD